MNVLIVDDHYLIRQGLKVALKELFPVKNICTANNGIEALKLLNQEAQNIDVVITDISMPGMNGVEFIKELMAIELNVKIIVLSQHKESWILKDLLKLNVDSIILKDDDPSEISLAFDSINENKKYYSPEIQELIINSFTGKKKSENDWTVNLTKREKEVLGLIANENTNIEIAEKLFISNKTVECHRNNILYKFGARNTAGLIKRAIEFGFIE